MNDNKLTPGFTELWEGLTHARMDIAELKGMIKMHFRDVFITSRRVPLPPDFKRRSIQPQAQQ